MHRGLAAKDSPASYEILVAGHLDRRRAKLFPGMTLTWLPQGTTRLCGPVIDQAALHAMLTTIRDLGTALLLVRHLPAAGDQMGEGPLVEEGER